MLSEAWSYWPRVGLALSGFAALRAPRQTPDEMYFGTGDPIPAELESAKQAARHSRMEVNRATTCPTCELLGSIAVLSASTFCIFVREFSHPSRGTAQDSSLILFDLRPDSDVGVCPVNLQAHRAILIYTLVAKQGRRFPVSSNARCPLLARRSSLVMTCPPEKTNHPRQFDLGSEGNQPVGILVCATVTIE